MAPKRVNYGKFALQASLIFAAGHAARLTYSGNPSADWPAFVLSVAAWGLMGAAFVAVFAVIHVKIVLPNPSKEKSRKLLILGITLMVLAFAWFIPMLDQAGRWFPDPDIANRVILWPFLILTVPGAAFAGQSLGKWFRRSTKRGLDVIRQLILVVTVVAMAAVITGVDFAFLQGRFWLRLIVNIAIVLVFLAFYLRYLRHP